MPRKRKAATVAQQPSRQPGDKKGKKIKVLAKMILQCARKNNQQMPVETVPMKKQRKARTTPPSAKEVAWRNTFKDLRKKYPGRNNPEFAKALKDAGAKHRQKFAVQSKSVGDS